MSRPANRDDPTEGDNVVHLLAFQLEDAAIVTAIRRGEARGPRLLFDRYAAHVARVLTRLLGSDAELADLVQDVFLMAVRDLGRLREPSSLRAWLTSMTVYSARGHIRRKKRRRWLRYFAPEEMPESATPFAEDDVRQAARRTYAVLETLPDDERFAFALRVIDDMDLKDVAAACGTSLATIKRRLVRAEAAFVAAAKSDPILQRWLEQGSRWGTR
jgi:RNA polymerase sigma-70 factor (ECF subfamily)